MGELILETIIKWAVPFLCGAVVSLLVAVIKNQRDKNRQLNEVLEQRNSAVEDGLQCLLRAEIIRDHDKYMERGYCPVYAKEALKRAYTAYHNLDGNDIATKLYNDTMQLPEEGAERR